MILLPPPDNNQLDPHNMRNFGFLSAQHASGSSATGALRERNMGRWPLQRRWARHSDRAAKKPVVHDHSVPGFPRRAIATIQSAVGGQVIPIGQASAPVVRAGRIMNDEV